MGKAQEVELKLEIDPADAVRLRAHPLLAAQPGHPTEQVSTYYDAKGRPLHKAGYSVRVRRCGERFVQTVKSGGSGGAGLYDRPEWEGAIAGPGLDAEALAHTPVAGLLGTSGAAALHPCLVSRIERRVWDIAHHDAQIQLSLDCGTIEADGAAEPLCELELELKQGDADALMGLARTLVADLPLRISVLTKAERGFALADGTLGHVAKAEPVRLAADMSVGEGFVAIVHACLRHFRLNEAPVARREAAALHQARVAMRRLRSALSLFGPVIRDEAYRRLREELRWFTGELGEARNIDVFVRRLGDDVPEPWQGRIVAAREAAYDRVEAALASPRLQALILDFVGWTEFGDWRRGERAGGRLDRFADRRLDRRWKKVRKHGKAIAGLDPEARHRLRIEVKKLRYAVHFFAGLPRGAEAEAKHRAFADALEALQDALGELNDIETGHALVEGLGEGLDKAPPLAALDPKAEAARSRTLLAKAQKAHDMLRDSGPFWR